MPEQVAEKAWYIVTTQSTAETKTAENLRRRIESMKMQDYIFRIVVAEVEVDELKDGQPEPKKKKRNLYPGYIFVEMIMTDQSWYIVRNTPGVTGIVGSSGGGQKPNPIRSDEIESVLKRVGMVDESMYSRYNVGDRVKIIKGAFEGIEGKIVSLDKTTGAVQIETIFFGRANTVDLDFEDIQKVK